MICNMYWHKEITDSDLLNGYNFILLGSIAILDIVLSYVKDGLVKNEVFFEMMKSFTFLGIKLNQFFL